MSLRFLQNLSSQFKGLEERLVRILAILTFDFEIIDSLGYRELNAESPIQQSSQNFTHSPLTTPNQQEGAKDCSLDISV